MTTYPSILDRLGRGQPVNIRRTGGGCIADSMVAGFADGSRVFVKRVQNVAGMFECEANGLRALENTKAIRVPGVLAVGSDTLVLEFIDEAPRRPDFFEFFGRAFARLHDCSGPCSGFFEDNFIGLTPQYNQPLNDKRAVFSRPDNKAGDGSDWPEFFIERRLRYQARLAAERGHGGELARLLDRAEQTIRELLQGVIEPPGLLHGDLWGGNFIADETGEACLIDPAVYYGHREADLAMTELFGGFDSAFYNAYREQSPLEPGYEERRPIYQLYHLLNHLNLFGSAYYARCQQILERYSKSRV